MRTNFHRKNLCFICVSSVAHLGLRVSTVQFFPMKDDLSNYSMLELFRVEAEHQTGVLMNGLLEAERGRVAPPLLESLMRAAHSIKGAARIINLPAAVSV